MLTLRLPLRRFANDSLTTTAAAAAELKKSGRFIEFEKDRDICRLETIWQT